MIGFSLGYWRRKVIDDIIMVRILLYERFWTPFIILLKADKKPEV